MRGSNALASEQTAFIIGGAMPQEVSQTEFGRLCDRVEGIEEELRGLAPIQADLREIKTRLEAYATTEAVYKSIEPIRASLSEMGMSVAGLGRDVSSLSRDVGEAMKKVQVIFDLHEAALQERARTDREAAEGARRIAEEKLQKEQEARRQQEETHLKEMQAIEERKQAEIAAIKQEQEDRKFVNRLRKNWLPFLGALFGVLISLAAIVAGIIKGFEWVLAHWK